MNGMATILGILLLGIVTTIFKTVGPVTTGGRDLPPLLGRAADLLPTALIAGLVMTQVASGPIVSARLFGVVAAGVAVALRAPFAVVVLIGAATAAILRSVGLR
jgi:branched-subunit amino acid transport protein